MASGGTLPPGTTWQRTKYSKIVGIFNPNLFGLENPQGNDLVLYFNTLEALERYLKTVQAVNRHLVIKGIYVFTKKESKQWQ